MSAESILDPAGDLDAAVETQVARRAPFSQVGDWVLFSGATPEAKTLYWALMAHVNAERGDSDAWPSLRSLARILGMKKPDSILRYVLELEILNAIKVRRIGSGLRRRNHYVVYQSPPATFTGVQKTAELYRLNRALPDETPKETKRREDHFDAWLSAQREHLKKQVKFENERRATAHKNKTSAPPLLPYAPPVFTPFTRTSTEREDLVTERPSTLVTASDEMNTDSDATCSESITESNDNRSDSVTASTQKAAKCDTQSDNSIEPQVKAYPPARGYVPPATGVRTPLQGGPVPPCRGVEKDQENKTNHHPPSPISKTGCGDPRRTAVGGVEEFLRRKNPGPLQPAPASPAMPDPTQGAHKPLQGAPEENEDPSRAAARQWVHHTLTEKTPDAAMLTRPQAQTLVDDVATLLKAGWTPGLITRHIGRLHDLKYRFTPVRDKLIALQDIDPSTFTATPSPTKAPPAADTAVNGPVLAKQDALREITSILSAGKPSRLKGVST